MMIFLKNCKLDCNLFTSFVIRFVLLECRPSVSRSNVAPEQAALSTPGKGRQCHALFHCAFCNNGSFRRLCSSIMGGDRR